MRVPQSLRRGRAGAAAALPFVDRGGAEAVLDLRPAWIADYDAVAPHDALGYRAPQQHRAERLEQV